MPTYTVTAVNGSTPKPGGKFGDMQDISLDLSDGTQTWRGVSWYTKVSTQMPAQGGQLEGDITEDPQWGPKFKKAYNPNGNGGGGGAFKSSAMSPDREKKIVRQHSQEMALRYLAVAGGECTKEMVKKITDWFEADILGDGKVDFNALAAKAEPTLDEALLGVGSGDTIPF